jgi:hypothetical protein
MYLYYTDLCNNISVRDLSRIHGDGEIGAFSYINLLKMYL